MDRMSYRNSRPTQPAEPEQPAAPVHRPQAVSSAPVEEPVSSTPARTKHTRSHESNRKSPKSKFGIVALLIAIVAAGIGIVFFVASTMGGASGAIDGGKYQAVFLPNNQVYFGKLSVVNNEYMRLKNVYYLQNKKEAASDVESSPQAASKQNSNDMELVKLGNEVHGPEDEMIIAKDQILFFENLKIDGTVSKTITEFQNSRK